MRHLACVALLLVFALFPAAADAGSPLDPPSDQATISGRVIDPAAGAVSGARVTLTPARPGQPTVVVTNAQGEFRAVVPSGAYRLEVVAAGFLEIVRRYVVMPGAPAIDVVLEVAPVQEEVTVGASGGGYSVPAVSSATRTATALQDVPQAVSVVSSTLIADQRMTSIADVVRYMPGVGIAQGEGNRDTPILRGNSSTADFFVDGVRDDVQYFRDLYNVDRVEALKGPNAMIFGRGGAGGVINRVTRQADWSQTRELALQFGSWGDKRLTADFGTGVNGAIALRGTALHEQADSYRDGVTLERSGVNPTLAWRASPATTVRAGYEYFHDRRTADRGITSVGGRPVATSPSTFFGDPDRSWSEAGVHVAAATIEHRRGSRVTVRSRVSYGSYDKFYQNVYPGAADAASVALSAYNNATTRRNLFNQTDLIATAETGRFGHTLLVGVELGRQVTDNERQTGYFGSVGTLTTLTVPLDAPTVSTNVAFRQSATDADNHGVSSVRAAYAQDQIALSRQLQAVVGLRFDAFTTRLTHHRTDTRLSSDDRLVSPRLGVVYKPAAPVSLYGGYSLTYLPRAGEQLSSLSLSNRALDPEVFRNYEVGAKWEVSPSLFLTAAAYRLTRGNVAVADPLDPAVMVLVDAQRTHGLELEWNGRLTRSWSIAGGYAWQDGVVTRSIASSAQAGAVLAQLPTHSLSLWSRYDMTTRLGVGAGVLRRGEVFTSTDNSVRLPAWTRLDAGLFYRLTPVLRVQLNVENLLDIRYYPSAHSNTNITPGSPRAVRVALTTAF